MRKLSYVDSVNLFLSITKEYERKVMEETLEFIKKDENFPYEKCLHSLKDQERPK